MGLDPAPPQPAGVKRLNERLLSPQCRPHLVLFIILFLFLFCCCISKMPVMFSFAGFLLVAVRYIPSNKYPAAPAQEVFSAHNIPTAIMFTAPWKEKKRHNNTDIFDDSDGYAVFCRQHSEINPR